MNEVEANELCICSRSKVQVHCPRCGSYQILGYVKRELVKRENGDTEELRVYRCRRCSEMFNYDKWQKDCHAPSSLGRRPMTSQPRGIDPPEPMDTHPTMSLEELFERAGHKDELEQLRRRIALDNVQN